MNIYKIRRTILILLILISIVIIGYSQIPISDIKVFNDTKTQTIYNNDPRLALNSLKSLEIKDNDSGLDYSRDKFGSDWSKISGCDMRNIILNRDLNNVSIDEKCNVTSGVLNDPYTSKVINFKRGSGTSSLVQIDHVVSLSNAWKTGAKQFTQQKRIELANDPLELLAVDGLANQQKSDNDASTWLPPNESFRCQYIARQIAVKIKYLLWVTKNEFNVMKNTLEKCPYQLLPTK